MIYFFQNKTFGDTVKEIAYYGDGTDFRYLRKNEIRPTYGRKNKSIGCYFIFNMETIQFLEGKELLYFVSEQVIKETNRFVEKKIRNFDLEGYIKNLKQYFREAQDLINEGKDPSEGKLLNEDIKAAMLVKFSRL